MTTTIKTIVRIGAVSGILAGGIIMSGNAKKQDGITCKTLQFAGGWGYEISIKDHVLIHQESVPGVSSLQGFKTEKQAMSAALLVRRRLREKNNPTLNPEDIAEITANKQP